MMYLEDVLNTMVGNADVMVLLSSTTKYESGFIRQDGCGNHYAENWLAAIHNNGLKCLFVVKDVKVEKYSNRMQWTIVLENSKDKYTKILDIEANETALWNSLCK